MYFPLVLIVPICFVYYSAGSRFAGQSAYRLSYLSGTLAALPVILMDLICGSLIPSRTPYFVVKLIDVYVSGIVLPLIVAPIILFFVAKVPIERRIRRIVPQLFGILTVYLPWFMFSDFMKPDFWPVVILPALFLALVFMVDICINTYLGSIRLGPTHEGLLFALIPAGCASFCVMFAVTIWYLNKGSLLLWIVTLIVPLATLFIRLKKYRA